MAPVYLRFLMVAVVCHRPASEQHHAAGLGFAGLDLFDG
jgi:hypothetical protein